MKTNGAVYNANCNGHLDFRGMQVFCGVLQKKCCSDHPLVQFSSTKVILDSILLNFAFIFNSNSQNKISILFLFYFCKIHVGIVVNQLIKKV